MTSEKIKDLVSQSCQYEYRFERLEKQIVDPEIRDEEYHGHLEIDNEKTDLLGSEGWLLLQVVFIDGEQCGWFVRKKT